jgi:CMP-N,N'-diacetyllegionaminic acid synthase
MNILITLCARGGSKGVPGKNIKSLNGQPLIFYTLQTAAAFAKKYAADIILSTDSKDIKNTVKALSFAHVNTEYTRPDYLATDSAGKLDAIIDVKNFAEKSLQKKYDFLIDMDVTSPLRNVEDMEQAFTQLVSNKEALNSFSVNPANRNPYFNMVEEKGDGFVELCKSGNFLTRQSAPKVYDLNASFYIYKKDFFDGNYKKIINEKAIVYEVKHICFYIDHAIDFEIMEFLISNNKLDFKL